MSSSQRVIPIRPEFKYFVPISTRWHDNDAYGHVNNAVYYSYFDTAANIFLLKEAGWDMHNSPVIGLVVHSECQYHASIEFPDDLEVGFGVARLGTSSVTYRLAIFVKGADTAVAEGHFTHVFVDRQTRKPVSIPAKMRTALEEHYSSSGLVAS